MSKFLFIVLLFAAFLRFYQLGDVPQGFTDDELGYVYNAYSIAETGKNIFGETLPFLTWVYGKGVPFMPTTLYLNTVSIKLFGLSFFSARFTSAFLGVMDVFLLYLLVKMLFRSERLALVSSVFLTISPWHIFLSRTAYDTNVAFFFYLLSITLFFWEVKSKRVPFLSSLAILLAVFSYRAMSAIFFPLMILLFWYGSFSLKMSKKQVISYTCSVVLMLGIFLFVVTKNASRGYIAEATINATKMQEDIDGQIREASGPLWLRRLYANKPSYIFNIWRAHFLESFSPGFLFLTGENGNIISIWSRGKLYILDVVFLVFGVFYLLVRQKSAAFLVFGILLIAALPGTIGGPIYIARNFFMASMFPILTGAGTLFLLKNIRLLPIKIFLTLFLIIGYSYLLGGFLFDYYNRFNLYASENWYKSLKTISNIISLKKDQYKSIVVAPTAIQDVIQYAFHAKIDPVIIQDMIRRKHLDTFTTGNVMFKQACDLKKYIDSRIIHGKGEGKTMLIVRGQVCLKEQIPSQTVRDFQGNVIWRIYE